MFHSMIRATLAILALACASLAHAQGCQNKLVVFGDSLTDPGNFYAATGTTSKAPYSLIPNAPYAIGGHHFSNGRTWAEQLSESISSPTSGLPALANPGLFTNYAVGGARARPGASPTPYDLISEVGQFLTDFGGRACANATYVIWIGGDDLRDALQTLPQTGIPGAAAIISAAVTSIGNNVTALWSAGARNFLILDAPDVSNAPAVRLAGPGAIGAGAFLSANFNSGLGQAIAELQTLPGSHFARFDDNAVVASIIADPAAFGLTDVRDPCLQFGVAAGTICQSPPSFLFWDGIHPTVVGQGIVANAVRLSLF
jgi:phospholipase/lecithinase/hemolysin